MVADEHILAYQKKMVEVVGGRAHEILTDVYFLQPFFASKDDVDYFARKFTPWSHA
jgi:hypothetical protein